MKSALSPMKIVAIWNYLLCELFSNRYILLTQQTVGWSAWLYGYGLHPQWQFVDQLFQMMYCLEFSLVLFLLLGVRLLSIISSMWSAPNKAKHFGNTNSGYFHWIISVSSKQRWQKMSNLFDWTKFEQTRWNNTYL